MNSEKQRIDDAVRDVANMEHREVVALALLFAMLVVFGAIAAYTIGKRRRFKERQAGRGKGNDV